MNSRTAKNDKAKILEFFIFHRSGTCLLHLDLMEEYAITTNKAINASTNKEMEHRYKLLFGIVFSMKSFVNNLSTREIDFFKSFSTPNYKLHYVEFLNGLRFCLMTTPTTTDFGTDLKEVHRSYYTTYISKNIFINTDEQIKNEIFLEQVKNHLLKLNQ